MHENLKEYYSKTNFYGLHAIILIITTFMIRLENFSTILHLLYSKNYDFVPLSFLASVNHSPSSGH
jgi:hypothetical protein